MFGKKRKEEHEKQINRKEGVIDEELRIANEIIQRFSKWTGVERRHQSDAYDGLERRHA